jgi:hypothetical protein
MEAASNAARCVLSKTNYRVLSQKVQICWLPLPSVVCFRASAASPKPKSRCCPDHRSPKQNGLVTNYRPDRVRTHRGSRWLRYTRFTFVGAWRSLQRQFESRHPHREPEELRVQRHCRESSQNRPASWLLCHERPHAQERPLAYLGTFL